nr:IS30 family transposase [Antricoccus suffuscus]
MCRPADCEYDSRYLNLLERREIARLHEQGVSIRQIASRLGRSPSTISRELRRHWHESFDTYLPEFAHHQAWTNQRRAKPSKISLHQRLREYVQQKLNVRLSPEQISGRLLIDHPQEEQMRISAESIYQSIYVYPRGELTRELKATLRTKRTRRRTRGSRHTSADTRIPNLVSIHQRPDEVAGRAVPGHHEGDLIKGSTASNSAVGTIVERHTGFVSLLHLPDGWASDQVVSAAIEQFEALPAFFAKTLTWDRGTEMSHHQQLTKATGIGVYFADPYKPQQRPSNENTNGLLREYLPKGEDLSRYSRTDLHAIAEQLNDRPRKRLGFYTPREVFTKLLNQDLENQERVATTP